MNAGQEARNMSLHKTSEEFGTNRVKDNPQVDSFSQQMDRNDEIHQKADEGLGYTPPGRVAPINPYRGFSRRRLYHVRHDVIAKILFRCLRKFYLKEFKSFFDYSN
mmetsp:Transcript_19132/g.22075  ORF Transcript_19132/g.22075 Transcript_19132/m.22075 type:complete len:106 (-) Transcript_19132:762-1079(-)